MKKFLRKIKYQIYEVIEKLVFNNKMKGAVKDLIHIGGQTALVASQNLDSTSKNLWDFEVKVYSQWGEDGILSFLTRRISIYKPKILEIGVGDFTECNSRALVEFRNASAYLVDINIELEKTIKNSDSRWKNHVETEILWVDPENINSIVDNAKNFMSGLDIISLDIDGVDYWVLKAMKIPIEVKIIVVEYNPLFGHLHKITVPFKDNFDRAREHFSHLYFGCSLLAWIYLLEQRGFTFTGTNLVGNNAFFVRTDLSDSIGITTHADLSLYTDWRIRESRNINGELNYLSGSSRFEIISDQLVYDVSTNKTHKLKILVNS